jgi:hypothetical protein
MANNLSAEQEELCANIMSLIGLIVSILIWSSIGYVIYKIVGILNGS